MSKSSANQPIIDALAAEQALSYRMEEEFALVFPSNTMVLNVEDLLEEIELPFSLIPVPKELNPNCGLAICFCEKDRAEIMRALEQRSYWPSAAYCRRDGHFKPWPFVG